MASPDSCLVAICSISSDVSGGTANMSRACHDASRGRRARADGSGAV